MPMNLTDTYLGPKGYSIFKTELSIAQQHKIRKDLNVKPFVPPNSIQKAVSFSIYRESPKKLYVPRFYGIKQCGPPSYTSISDGDTIHVPFEGTLRDNQINIINAYMKESKKTGCGLLEVPCGRGKCLGYGTPIKMYNGMVIRVENIKDGDVIVGDDFEPRIVYGVRQGQSKMYKIKQSQGITYSVNENHIISLYDSYIQKIIDMTITAYLSHQQRNNTQHLFGIRVFEDDAFILSELHVTPEPFNKYYGFCVDNNHRFLLGDHTVTHNTVMALNIVSLLEKKTLVIVHKEFLMSQWTERIHQFLPTARVGKIQGPIMDVQDKDIVLGMLQSISMKDYPKELFEQFGLTIIDETHHISAEVFSRSLFKIITPYMLGLSATMDRKDGLTKVFKMFLGNVVYKETRSTDDKVNVRCISYTSTDDEFSKTLYNFKGQTHYALMIRKLCEFNHRSEFILKILKDILAETPDQQIMILAHNKSLLKYLYDAIEHRKIASVGYYIGGMKQKALKETETKQVVIATYAMAEEALDIKSLATLIMATPRTSVTQAVGRILRIKHKNPIVVDIVDQHEIFQRQWKKRRQMYIKSNYRITTNTIMTYNNNFDTWDVMYEPGQRAKRCKKQIIQKDRPPLLQGKCLIKIDVE